MNQIRTCLNQILKGMAGASFLAMVILTCWQVFTRYMLKNPSSWSEELVSYLFAWMALLGSSLVAGERGHMNIPIVVDRVGPGAKKALAIFAELTACLFSLVILVFGGIQITSLAMGQTTSSLGIAVGIFYVVLPLSGILNIIYTLFNMVDIAKGPACLENKGEQTKAALGAGKGA